MPKPANNGALGPRPGAKARNKAKNVSGLGRSLVNQRQNSKKQQSESDRYTTDSNESGWIKLRSVTQEGALEDFLSTAELADTDFTTERTANVRIINGGTRENPYLLSVEQQKKLQRKHAENDGKLTVPRRPLWDGSMTPHQLDRLEKDAFLDWRRELASLQENSDLLLTPFERNVEVWRQLWRVVERSDLVVQIVDARNPLLFRSRDLEHYVKELDERKKNFLLINKADLLSVNQRKSWAEYFNEKGIRYAFFSAATSLRELEAKEELKERNGLSGQKSGDDHEEEREYDEEESEDEDQIKAESDSEEDVKDKIFENVHDETHDEMHDDANDDAHIEASANYAVMQKDPTRILSVDQLEDLFLAEAPEPMFDLKNNRLQIGLVGYPNVGKSSTINALIGAKKVSVSSTPGKTKHFQTIMLSSQVMLCDCPGLVFPNFATTNADLVCNGVLPIDQLREFSGPVQLVSQRIPKFFLEAVYGISIFTKPIDEGGNGVPTAEELLIAYARSRGFMRSGQGNPDESRAARYVLKDYVNAKLMYCHPPPQYLPDDENRGALFNRELYTLSRLPESRRQQIMTALRSVKKEHELPKDLDMINLANELDDLKFGQHDSITSKSYAQPQLSLAVKSAGTDLDRDFFAMDSVRGVTNVPFHLRGKSRLANSGKKHNKKNKKGAKGSVEMSNYGGSFGDLY